MQGKRNIYYFISSNVNCEYIDRMKQELERKTRTHFLSLNCFIILVSVAGIWPMTKLPPRTVTRLLSVVVLKESETEHLLQLNACLVQD